MKIFAAIIAFLFLFVIAVAVVDMNGMRRIKPSGNGVVIKLYTEGHGGPGSPNPSEIVSGGGGSTR